MQPPVLRRVGWALARAGSRQLAVSGCLWAVLVHYVAGASAATPVRLFLSSDQRDLPPLTWDPRSEDVTLVARSYAREHGLNLFGCGRYCRSDELEAELRRQHAVNEMERGEPRDVRALPLRRGSRLLDSPLRSAGAVLALYSGHDASLAMAKDGRVQCVLELERYFKRRYYNPPVEPDQFRTNWLAALLEFRDNCVLEGGEFPNHFDAAVVVKGYESAHWSTWLPAVVEELHTVERWHFVDHQEAHALLGFYTSPFRSALILSYDGGGNDGAFNAYVGSDAGLHRIAQLQYNVGGTYLDIASLLPEVRGLDVNDMSADECAELLTDPQHSFTRAGEEEDILAWAGKLMGYAATGAVEQSVYGWAKRAFEASALDRKLLVQDDLKLAVCESVAFQRSMAASAQNALEDHIAGVVHAFLDHVGLQQVEGVVLTGGCALNVLANQRIADTLPEPLQLHVPPAPSDSGLTAGALFAVSPPHVRGPLQYLGFRLWDAEDLESFAAARQARRLSELGGVAFLAELLAREERRPIVAVVRGRQEIGPRALGHRSLLAVPDGTMQARMNRLKARQWYRPVAPMIADEHLARVFGREVKSPYMSHAPRVLDEIRAQFPGLAHLDGTARHQSMGRRDEPWLHELLLSVGRLTGLAALINTSFNTRGEPIVNTVKDCLEMLDDLPDLDYVLIEDWLFHSPGTEP